MKHAFASVLLVFVAAEPALAGSPVPGPLLGAGAPVLAVLAAGYYLIRRRRQH
jgi:lipopolysaccharide export LptBFGC system permease protein LptF